MCYLLSVVAICDSAEGKIDLLKGLSRFQTVGEGKQSGEREN